MAISIMCYAKSKPDKDPKILDMLQILGWSSIVFVETINYTFFIYAEVSIGVLYSSSVYCQVPDYWPLTSIERFFIKPSLFEKSLSRIWLQGINLDTFFITLTMVLIFFSPLLFEVNQVFQRRILNPIFGTDHECC
jgi:two-component system, LytTR family, sensor kinase